jgi:hypothetical protein
MGGLVLDIIIKHAQLQSKTVGVLLELKRTEKRTGGIKKRGILEVFRRLKVLLALYYLYTLLVFT